MCMRRWGGYSRVDLNDSRMVVPKNPTNRWQGESESGESEEGGDDPGLSPLHNLAREKKIQKKKREKGKEKKKKKGGD